MKDFFKKESPILSLLGMGGGGTGTALGGGSVDTIKASGGSIVEPGNGFVYHVFIANGNFERTVDSLSAVDYLVVAGGGGGGSYYGAGGGAGGYRTHSPNGGALQPAGAITVGASAIAVTVGDGGATNNTKGSNSSFGVISSEGGGGGQTGGGGGAAGTTGGSGGGGGVANGVPTNPGYAGNTPPVSPPQGNSGGAGYYLGHYPAGGGGGAGGPGGTAGNNSGDGGTGGAGYPNPDFAAPLISPALTAASVPGAQVTAFTNAVGPTGLYAGGGGGATATGTQGAGGSGGGGTAGINPGVEYTGGGGGGNFPPAGSWDGQGGKGIVIVRYAA